MAYNYGLRPGVTQKISPSGSSVATSNAFGSQTEYVRVAADADVHIVFATAPTATANDILYQLTNLKYSRCHQVKKWLRLVLQTFQLLR